VRPYTTSLFRVFLLPLHLTFAYLPSFFTAVHVRVVAVSPSSSSSHRPRNYYYHPSILVPFHLENTFSATIFVLLHG
jgi:hypothetical protein